MTQDIQIPNFKDLDKILHDKLVEKAEDALAHQYDAIINGLDDD
jgi:hypothetical protein